MATAVIMPRQGQSVERCILTTWYKDEGDEVFRGEPLFAYETDKASFEEEAREEGVLLARFFGEGEEVPVLVNVAVIGAKGEDVGPFRPGEVAPGAELHRDGEQAVRPPGEGETPGAIEDPPRLPQDGGGRLAISPRAKKLAAEKRIVVKTIRGTGPGGRIIERDILEEIREGKRLTPLAKRKLEGEGLAVPLSGRIPYGKVTSRELVEPSPDPSGPGPMFGKEQGYTDIPLSHVRKIIASAMHQSLRNSAQLTHHLGANASKMLLLRGEIKKRMAEGYPHNITLNDMVCYAAIRALQRFPGINAHFLDGIIRQFSKVNLGLAVDTERGLLVPALPGADDLSLSGLSDRLREMAESSREGKISPDLLAPQAATFTVSNLGNYGVEMFTPVINLPQVAILGVNAILHRPVEREDGSFDFQPFIGLSLTYDHRAIDGGPATQFLAEVSSQVEKLSPHLL